MFPSLARELLSLLRCGGSDIAADNATRAIALAAADEVVRRLLQGTATPGRGGAGGGGGGAGGSNSKVGGAEIEGARQVRGWWLKLWLPLFSTL